MVSRFPSLVAEGGGFDCMVCIGELEEGDEVPASPPSSFPVRLFRADLARVNPHTVNFGEIEGADQSPKLTHR